MPELDPLLLARIDALGSSPMHADWKGALRLMFAGERQAEVFRTPGMPLYWQWSHRKKRDPAFAELAREASAVRGRRGGRMPLSLVDEVVEGFASGAGSPRAVSRLLGGKPSATAIREMYAADETFRARVQPHWTPAERTQEKHSAADFERATAAVEAGATMAGLSSLGLPSATALKARRQRDGRLSQRLAAVQVAKAERREQAYEALVAKLEEGVVGKALPALGLPSLDSLHRYRRRGRPDLSKRVETVLRPRWAPSYTPSDFERAIRAVEGGRSVKRLGELGLPGRTLIASRRRSDPAFAARLAAAQRLRSGNVAGEVNELRRALSANEVWAAVNSAVSRGLPSFVRDDVISEMVADVLEGYLEPADIRGAAREYVSEHYRESGEHRMRSLDDDLYGDGGRTLYDLLAA